MLGCVDGFLGLWYFEMFHQSQSVSMWLGRVIDGGHARVQNYGQPWLR